MTLHPNETPCIISLDLPTLQLAHHRFFSRAILLNIALGREEARMEGGIRSGSRARVVSQRRGFPWARTGAHRGGTLPPQVAPR